jgi:hypothetical protein
VGTGAEVVENYIKTTTPSGGSFGTPEEDFPFVGPNNPPITVNLAPNSKVLDAALGLRHEYFVYGTPDNQNFPPIVDPSFGDDGQDQVEFFLAAPSTFLIDVNNLALEFFVEEEEEEE